MLGVVPEGGDGVAVIVAHGERRSGGGTRRDGTGRGVLGGGVGGTYEFGKEVHLAAVGRRSAQGP